MKRNTVTLIIDACVPSTGRSQTFSTRSDQAGLSWRLDTCARRSKQTGQTGGGQATDTGHTPPAHDASRDYLIVEAQSGAQAVQIILPIVLQYALRIYDTALSML